MIKTKNTSQWASIFKNKRVWVAIGVTLGLLLFFRLGAIIPMPFITIQNDGNTNSFFELMNLLGGGGLSQVSIFAIGVSPYITAQIIVQLLSTDLIPPLSRMAKSGERGRKKLEIVTRLLALPFAVVQAYAILTMLTSGQQSFVTISDKAPFTGGSSLYYFFYVVLMVAGTYICIFISDLITKRGVGNGMSLIILSGIVAGLGTNFASVFASLGIIKIVGGQTGNLTFVISFIIFVLFYLGVLLAVTFINDSVRKIPIQQVGQALALRNEDLSYMPLKINTSGVIPVIFASSVMMIPSIIGQFLPNEHAGKIWIENYISLQSWSGTFIYFVLVILFTFFYSYVQINPEKISNDFRKSGRFIPGVKTGKETEKYLSKVLFRINCIGGPFLALVACLPYLVTLIVRAANNSIVISTNNGLGGTGIVILVSASLEFWQSIKSVATTSSYSVQRKEIEIIVDNSAVEDSNVAISQLW